MGIGLYRWIQTQTTLPFIELKEQEKRWLDFGVGSWCCYGQSSGHAVEQMICHLRFYPTTFTLDFISWYQSLETIRESLLIEILWQRWGGSAVPWSIRIRAMDKWSIGVLEYWSIAALATIRGSLERFFRRGDHQRWLHIRGSLERSFGRGEAEATGVSSWIHCPSSKPSCQLWSKQWHAVDNTITLLISIIHYAFPLIFGFDE